MNTSPKISITISANGDQANTEVKRLSGAMVGLQKDVAGVERHTAALTSSLSRMAALPPDSASIKFRGARAHSGRRCLEQPQRPTQDCNRQRPGRRPGLWRSPAHCHPDLAVHGSGRQCVSPLCRIQHRTGPLAKQVADMTKTVSQAVALSGVPPPLPKRRWRNSARH